MKHELLYQTQSEFNAAQGNSGNVTSITPGVAYIVETATVPHFNKTYDDMIVTYNVSDISSPTKLFHINGVKNNLKEVFIDKTEVPVSSLTNEYQFDTTGLHTVRYRYSSLTSLPESAFTQCTEIRFIKLPDSVSSFGRNVFYGCSSLETFTTPPKLHTFPNYTFANCSSLRELHISTYINITVNYMYVFTGCSKLKHVYYNTIADLFNSGYYQSTPTGTQVSPCSANKDGHLYIGGEEVFEITVPENVTKINAALFEGFRYITTIHMHDGITSIGNGAFNDCRSLNHTFEEMLPSSVTSIGNFAFHNCNSLHGDLIFSDTVRSIGSDAFSNIQNNNLGNVVVPSTVTSLGDTFIQYDKFKNITIYSRGGNNLNNRLVKEVGDGTGTLTFVPDFLETGNNSSDIRVKNFIFGGSYTFNWPSGERILFNGGATLDKIILTGSLTSNGISSFTNQVRQLKFISIGGEITNLKKLFYADNANMYNGVIMNFRYEGVATTPAVACASYSRLAKIYVGDGSSEEHDQAIYDLYAADTGEGGWNDQTEGGTSYMNKLDLWYNYHGQYRQE